MDEKTFYNQIYKAGLKGALPQWHSLIRLGQNKIPYRQCLRYLKPPGQVLDWGAGDGHFSFFLIQIGLDTIGYTFDELPDFLTREKSFQKVDGKPNGPVKIPFPDRKFDAVVSFGVLEHVHETGGEQSLSMREIHRILKEDGLFLCFHLPNRISWIEGMVKLANLFLPQKLHAHSKKFSRRDMEALVSPLNFKIIEYGRYNFLPRGRLNILPQFIADFHPLVWIFNAVDEICTFLFNPFCQNWFFIIKKVQ